MYGLVRKVSLEVGRRLTQKGFMSRPDYIFYLPYPEVIAILRDEWSDPKAIRRRIEANQNYMLSFRNFKNPNEVGQPWQYQHDKLEKHTDVKKVFRGIPCAQGKAAGRVRVIEDINQSGRLQPGDILVTRFTDPGWTPLFSLLSGVITETGGILSHAAVIAREYGIPAVLAVQNATHKLRDDQKVILNGNNGEVQILC
jgi:pyruvate,water dikinase